MIEKPLKQEVAEWKDHKVTKYLRKYLEADLQETLEIWGGGGFTMESQSGTIQLNSQALGGVKTLSQLLDYLDSDMDAEESQIQYEH